jgi:hypothetical protein
VFKKMTELLVLLQQHDVKVEDVQKLGMQILGTDHHQQIPALTKEERLGVDAEIILLAFEKAHDWAARTAKTSTDAAVREEAEKVGISTARFLPKLREAIRQPLSEEFRRGVKAGAEGTGQILGDLAKGIFDNLIQRYVNSLTEGQAMQLVRAIASGDLKNANVVVSLVTKDFRHELQL